MSLFLRKLKALFWPKYAREGFNRFLLSATTFLLFATVISQVTEDAGDTMLYGLVISVLLGSIVLFGTRALYLSRREFLYTTIDPHQYLNEAGVWHGIDFSPLNMERRGGRNDTTVLVVASLMIGALIIAIPVIMVILSGEASEHMLIASMLTFSMVMIIGFGIWYLYKNRKSIFNIKQTVAYARFASANGFVYEEALSSAQVGHLEFARAFHNERAMRKLINFQLSGVYKGRAFSFSSITFEFRKGMEFVGIIMLETKQMPKVHELSEYHDMIRDVEEQKGFIYATCENGIPKDRVSTLRLFRLMDEIISG